MQNNMIITTTSVLQGLEVDEYLGAISSHVVAGTNIFSDMAAGLSDIFGGRSKTYIKQLSSIHREAINGLKEQASIMGGNAILGLSIDHDEISGQGKSMFMVTAIGTAVRIGYKESQRVKTNNKSLDYSEMRILLRKQALLAKDRIDFSRDFWKFISTNRLHEFFPIVINRLHEFKSRKMTVPESFLKNSQKYFLSLPREVTRKLVYDCILDENLDVFSHMERIVKEENLLHLDSINNILDSKEFRTQKKSLVLLQYDKLSYTESDIEKLNLLIKKIKATFNVKAKILEEKAKLSSKVKKKWVCGICGHKNNGDYNLCFKCSRDIYGFANNEIRPQYILRLLDSKVKILREVFCR